MAGQPPSPSPYGYQPPSYQAGAGAGAPKPGGYQSIPPVDPEETFPAAAAGPAGSTPAAAAAAGMFYAVPGEGGVPRAEGDVDPDDWKFGPTVSQSALEVRNAFVRKVYSILFLQILFTTVIGFVMRIEPVQLWVVRNFWVIPLGMLGSLATIFALYFKRHSHPTNLILLGLFTALEALTLGVVVGYIKTAIVLTALLITTFVFLGLTLFSLQTRYDFMSWGTWLFAGLWALIGMGLVGLFFPWGRITEIVFGALGCVVFSGYILFDTQLIARRLSPDEWILACVSLYLDFINLFLSILRILQAVDSD